jgi:acetylornithine deacetylase/succinyl-diaminopimelate desuccinylase-like protein
MSNSLRTRRPRARLAAALLLGAAALLPVSSDGQPHPRDAVRDYRMANEAAIVRELADLVAIPNVADDSVNIRRNAAQLVAMLERRGVAARLLEAPGSPPAVFGELRSPGATRTVVFYAHYDGQPADSSGWATPPWEPVLRTGLQTGGAPAVPIPAAGQVPGEWRLYGRAASDDKAPIVAMLRAMDALRGAAIPLSVNLKFFFEGEEEAGSPNLRAMLERHRDLLGADLWLIGDGPVHQSGRQQVVFGVRGTMGVEMTVHGPARGLHSGHYGNWAYNPGTLMAHVIAGMRDEDGRITIAGFHDDVAPVSDTERAAVALIPSPDEALREDLQIGGTEADGAALAERIMLPALNVRGISFGNVAPLAANVISPMARASIDFRLVRDQTPERVRELVEAHLRSRGYLVLHREPSREERLAHAKIISLDWGEGYPAMRSDMSGELSRALVAAVTEAIGEQPILVPTLGGSLPLHTFGEVLGTPLIVLPIVNHDNNQHAANENLRIQNLWDGMEVYGVVLARLGRLLVEPPPAPGR